MRQGKSVGILRTQKNQRFVDRRFRHFGSVPTKKPKVTARTARITTTKVTAKTARTTANVGQNQKKKCAPCLANKLKRLQKYRPGRRNAGARIQAKSTPKNKLVFHAKKKK